MNRPLIALLAGALGLTVITAWAQNKPVKPAVTAQADVALRTALAKAVPGVSIESVKPSVIPGYKEVLVGNRIVYVSVDGKYLIQGSLIELASRDNLTTASEAVIRKGVLATAGAEGRIIFPASKPKYRVTVFTDIDCGFCRKLHAQMADYNNAGISVEYLFFPRAGVGSDSFNKAISVWCAKDRQQAMTDAKLEKPVAKKTCPNPITKTFELGQKVGVDGTPAVYTDDGTQLGGYLAPADMIAALDRKASKASKAGKATAAR